MFKLIVKLIPRLLIIGLLLEVLILGLSWKESGGVLAPFFQLAAMMSGRVSLFFFAMLLGVATVYPSFDKDSENYHKKYLLYRDFAIIHVIHLVLLGISIRMNDFELLWIRVIAGAMAYLAIVAMPILIKGNWVSEKTLSGLQGFYMFWVWMVFTMTYTKRLSGEATDSIGSPAVLWPLFMGLILLIFWRSAYMLLKTMERRGGTTQM